jgi:hypothetical protein
VSEVESFDAGDAVRGRALLPDAAGPLSAGRRSGAELPVPRSRAGGPRGALPSKSGATAALGKSCASGGGVGVAEALRGLLASAALRARRGGEPSSVRVSPEEGGRWKDGEGTRGGAWVAAPRGRALPGVDEGLGDC